jgi:MarR-like DNA-binding transcriptional regulator SgrR of sgrS sRNA
LDKAIRQAKAMEVMFITNRRAKEGIARMQHSGRLAWDSQVTIADFKKFLLCRDELETILVKIEENLVESS